ncbi:MAG TPA: cysteine desulfurase family protein [Longimicrobiales bacterium]|nr:cysteine desulfurase family protein [Longimicrobiales bacterium]
MGAIYLDHAATTPVRPEVLEAMLPLLGGRFGNPSSVHQFGREARAALEHAREQVAGALGAARREIYFTSGGTEADNLAVLGRARAVARPGQQPIVAVSAIEHKAVLGAAKEASREGAELVVLAVDERGLLDLDALDQLLRAQSSTPVAVLAAMWANNEVGTLQPVGEIADRCAAAGIAFHTDAVQAFGRVPVRVDTVGCATLAVSGHKIGAPKGIGALFVRSDTDLVALVHGGGQERAVRPGTENVAGAVALGAAAELAVRELAVISERMQRLRNRLEHALRAAFDDVVVNGDGAPRVPHILNVSIPGVDQELLLVSLDLEGIAVSSGSACQSGTVDPSHVLMAMGRVRPGDASLRFSLGATTTEQEIDLVIHRLPQVVTRLRQLAHSA